GDHAPRRLLYVEDNDANRLLMRRLLARRPGIELQTAASVHEALQLAPEFRPDLLLLDIQLSDGDGHELLRRLRERGVAAPAVAVSANMMPADLRRGRDAGFCGYLAKPIDLRRLSQSIDDALASR
ncbi:MAG: response regulator, partial [Burkholderiaceae bacterium]|nr:response regulator [Burkholderiaceae bacterium]